MAAVIRQVSNLMPQDVGYTFVDFELNQIAKELADMQGMAPSPDNLQMIKQAVIANPALGANTITGREIAAQALDPIASSGPSHDSFTPGYFQAPGAQEALAAFQSQQQAAQQSPDVAPISLYNEGQPAPVDIGAQGFPGGQQVGNGNRNHSASRSAPVRNMEAPAQRSQATNQRGNQGSGPIQSGQGQGQESTGLNINPNDFLVQAVMAGLGGAGLGIMQNRMNAGRLPPIQAQPAAPQAPGKSMVVDNSISGEIVDPAQLSGPATSQQSMQLLNNERSVTSGAQLPGPAQQQALPSPQKALPNPRNPSGNNPMSIEGYERATRPTTIDDRPINDLFGIGGEVTPEPGMKVAAPSGGGTATVKSKSGAMTTLVDDATGIEFTITDKELKRLAQKFLRAVR